MERGKSAPKLGAIEESPEQEDVEEKDWLRVLALRPPASARAAAHGVNGVAAAATLLKTAQRALETVREEATPAPAAPTPVTTTTTTTSFMSVTRFSIAIHSISGELIFFLFHFRCRQATLSTPTPADASMASAADGVDVELGVEPNGPDSVSLDGLLVRRMGLFCFFLLLFP